MDLALNDRPPARPENAPSDDSGFIDAISSLKALCQSDLEAVDRQILDSLASPVAMIPELAGHLIKAGGKRLRPLLTISTAKMLGYDGSDHVKLATAVELIHGATLLHDDVVDGSSMRRGEATANILWGNKESVLVGDFVFSRAFELMVSTGKLPVLEVLSNSSRVIAEGEVLQLTTQKNLSASQETYLAVVQAKTAALFAAAARVGAIISNVSTETESALTGFGRNLGIAFQLIDDALDYAGREAALGKEVGDDFREGKMTLPVVMAVSKAVGDEVDFWKRTIGDGNQRPDDFDRAVSLIERHGALEETVKMANHYADAALKALAPMPKNEYRDALEALSTQSVARLS
ncbi:MAG: polyprenyl synthetase family protein [Pseudomonadota bacterium]